MVIGSTTYAFSLILAGFLSGIAFGSMIYAWQSTREKVGSPTLYSFGFVQTGIGISALLLIPVFGILPFAFLKLFKFFSSHFLLFSISQFFLVIIPMLLPTTLMGFAFPLAVSIVSGKQLVVSSEKQSKTIYNIGSSVGNIYASNTLGCVIGAILCSLVFIPVLGIEKSIILGTSLNIFTGLIFIFLSRRSAVREERIRRATFLNLLLSPAVISGVYFMFIISFFPEWDKYIISSGIFRDAPKMVKWRNIKENLKNSEIIFYKEGKIFTVSIKKDTETGILSLCIDGKPDASTDLKGDMITQVLSAHLPFLLSSKAENCLIVGLASGITLGEVQKYPLKEIVCCEIEPVMVDACKLFNQWNNNCLEDKKTKIVIDDIRGYLRKTKKKFDVIVSEPSNIWMRGEASLFTKEYFQMIKKSMNENGIFLQWAHTYNIFPSDYKAIARTLNSVFPYVYLWKSAKGDTFFLCSSKKIEIYTENLQRDFSKNKAYLSDIGIDTFFDLLSNFVMGEKKTKEFAGEGRIHTDNFPFLEFSGAKSLYANLGDNLWNEILGSAESINKYLSSPVDSFKLVEFYIDKNMFSSAIDELNSFSESAVVNKIQIYNLYGTLYLKLNDVSKAEDYIRKAIKLNPNETNTLNNLSELYIKKNDFGQAEKTAKKILTLNFKDKRAYKNLGDIYLKMNKINEAIEILQKGLSYNQNDTILSLSLAAAYFKNNNLEYAERICQKLLKENGTYADAHFLMGEIYLAKGDPIKAQESFNLGLKIKPDFDGLLKHLE